MWGFAACSVVSSIGSFLNEQVGERLQLGQVEATDYARGENHFQFTVRVSKEIRSCLRTVRLIRTTASLASLQAADINVAGIEPSQLTNCGLLIASFKGRDGDVMDLKMVIQVTEQRGALQRIIYNPLE